MAVTDDMTGRVQRPGAATANVASALRSLPQALFTPKLPVPVLLYLIAVVLPIAFPLGPLAMTTLRLLLLIMVVPLMVQMLSGAYGKVLLPDILFILHMVWAVVALAVNNPDQVIQQVGSVAIEFLGGYVIGRAYIRTPEAFAALCKALVVIVLLMLPFAIFEALTGRPLIIEILNKIPGLKSLPTVTYEKRLGLERVQMVFAHPIHYGLFCSVAFSLAFVALRGISGTVWRFGTSVLVAGAGFLALSSGALLAIALQIGLISWAILFARTKKRWKLLLGLFAVAYVVVDLLSNRTPIDVLMTYATFSPYNAYWRKLVFEWGMVNVWDNPYFGIGLNDWKRPAFMAYNGSVDNFWLMAAMRYGIPGFLLLVGGYVFGIWRILLRNFDSDPMLLNFRRAWIFTFLGLSFTLCTVHIWSNIYSFTFFMFGAGMWFITAIPATTDQPAAPAPLRPEIRRTGAKPDSPGTGAKPGHPGTGANPPAAIARTGQDDPASNRFSRFPPVTKAD